MPGNSFVVTPTPPTVLKLAPGAEGRFSFTITVLDAPDQVRDVTLRAMLDNNGKHEEAAWLSVEPKQTLSLPGGSTEVATIVVRPTIKSPLGEHRIQLAVYDDERPHDNYTYSAPVICEIASASTSKPTTASRSLPRWLIPAIAAAALLGIGGIAIGLAGVNNRGELRMFDQRLRRLEAIRQPRKLCSAVIIGQWRDTIEVDDNWSRSTCQRWVREVDGREMQLGCLLPDGQFSMGSPNGGPPSPNCGW